MHKILRKMTSFLVAFFMVLSMITPAFAAEKDDVIEFADQMEAIENGGSNAGTISLEDVQKDEPIKTKLTIHKLESKKYNDGLPIDHNGGKLTQEQLVKLGKEVKELDGVKFKYYKINNAELFEKMERNPNAYKTVARMQQLTTVNSSNPFGDKAIEFVDETEPTKDGQGVNVELEKGYYWFVESYKPAEITTALAVPFGIAIPMMNKIKVANYDPETVYLKNIHVYPKNVREEPQIDKNFAKENYLNDLSLEGRLSATEGAKLNNYNKEKARVSAEIGKIIPYEVTSKIPMGASYEKLSFKDSMTNGLTYNKDLKITNGSYEINSEWYELKQDDRGFSLIFNEKGLKSIKNLVKDKDAGFLITYSATVNGNAIIDNPEKNDIRMEYGRIPKEEKSPTEVNPKNGELIVEKNWSNDGKEEIPNGVSVTYILHVLKEEEDTTYSVTLDSNIKRDHTFDLGKGIKFTTDKINPFNGKFTGLPKDGYTFKLEERVAGYNDIIVDGKDGKVTIKNTKDNNNPTPLNPTTPEVVVGGKKFVKTSNDKADNSERLTGAIFVVKNVKNGYLTAKDDEKRKNEKENLKVAKETLDKLIEEWNKKTKAEQDENTSTKEKINKAQESYNKAFKTASISYDWTENKEDAIKFVSDGEGRFEVVGLQYGTYYLEEETAPVGYAKLTEAVKFEVNKGSYNLHEDGITYNKETSSIRDKLLDAQQVKNKKITIPQTGGIGTVIFTVAGIVIMGLAGFVLIKNNKKDEELA